MANDDGIETAFQGTMENLCIAFYRGDPSALMEAIHQCDVFGRPPAQWMVEVARKARQSYVSGEVRTIGKVIGDKRPKGWSQKKERKIARYGSVILHRCNVKGRFNIANAQKLAAEIGVSYGWVKSVYPVLAKQEKVAMQASMARERARSLGVRRSYPPAMEIYRRVQEELHKGTIPVDAAKSVAADLQISVGTVLQESEAWKHALEASTRKRSKKTK